MIWYIGDLAKSKRAGEYKPPLPAWFVKDTGPKGKPERVKVIRLRGSSDYYETRKDYAELEDGRTVSSTYLFPMKPVFVMMKDEYGTFRNWVAGPKKEIEKITVSSSFSSYIQNSHVVKLISKVPIQLRAEFRAVYFGCLPKRMVTASGLDTKVHKEIKTPLFIIRDETVNNGQGNSPQDSLRWQMAYGHDGGFVGDMEYAKYLEKKGIKPERATPEHNTCSIGYCDREKKWYGWSHRAMCGFGVGMGHKVFEEDFGDDHTPFIRHGSKEIKTLDDAKLAAKRFAAYVS